MAERARRGRAATTAARGPRCSDAIAVFSGGGGQGAAGGAVRGAVRFHQCAGRGQPTVVDFDLSGFGPRAVHAVHIHEYGDASDGCRSLGGHWNPRGRRHGSLVVHGRDASHAGDLVNNIVADGRGRFVFRYADPRIQIRGDARRSILGRSVVIHAGRDDLGLGGDDESGVTGNAGARIAFAVIARDQRPPPAT